MEIIGRLTKDAQVKTLKDERQLVAFSIAIKDYYKTKTGDKQDVVTYMDCSYWISIKIAERLKKGTIVSLFGRVGLNAYNNMKGDAQASLTFHVNAIKLVAATKKVEDAPSTATAADNLPF